MNQVQFAKNGCPQMLIVDDEVDIAKFVVETLAMLGQKVGLKIGPEDAEKQSMQVRHQVLGCHYGQNYRYSKPIEVSAVPVQSNKLVSRFLQRGRQARRQRLTAIRRL